MPGASGRGFSAIVARTSTSHAPVEPRAYDCAEVTVTFEAAEKVPILNGRSECRTSSSRRCSKVEAAVGVLADHDQVRGRLARGGVVGVHEPTRSERALEDEVVADQRAPDLLDERCSSGGAGQRVGRDRAHLRDRTRQGR